MTLSTDSEIEHLALRFIDRSLSKAEWTHEAHWAAALWLARHRPELTAPDAMRALITGFNEATGTVNSDTSGYHHTITLASMRATAHHLHAHPADAPLHDVLANLMASPHGHPDWLLEYWTRETLFSPEARRDWVASDIAALPF